ncbi:hypothetical protein CMK17_04600 [Candidatus Poribacteria bacterium]|nr:hypothetical protein [Candidatus Poribacteria bacterium]|tara:strand:- start:806 stop:2116 length:1311 start_codon:yes stop_codon:yes gene_type:complete
MISLLAIALCIISGAIRKRLFSPIYLYSTILAAYPATVWVYSEIIPAQYIPQVFPYFTKEESHTFYIFSFIAVASLLLSELTLGKNRKTYYQPPENSKLALYSRTTSSIASLMLAALIISFVAINKEEFLQSYIYQLLRASEFEGSVANKISTFSALETAFLVNAFFTLIFWDGKAYKSKTFMLSVLMYLTIKILIGSRMMVVPLLLIGLLYYRENARATRYFTASKTHLKIYASLTTLIAIFITINYFRDREGSITLYEGWIHFTHEYLFASISALYSSRYVAIGNTPDGLSMFFDGVIGIIPSFIFGGANIKNTVLEFSQWKNSIGGFSNISPVGGYYMPGQIYLMTKSFFLTGLFFFSIGCLINVSEKLFYSSKKIWIKVASAQIACFGIVYGVRSEFWIFEKFIIQQAFIMTIIIATIYALTYKLFSKKSNV